MSEPTPQPEPLTAAEEAALRNHIEIFNDEPRAAVTVNTVASLFVMLDAERARTAAAVAQAEGMRAALERFAGTWNWYLHSDENGMYAEWIGSAYPPHEIARAALQAAPGPGPRVEQMRNALLIAQRRFSMQNGEVSEKVWRDNYEATKAIADALSATGPVDPLREEVRKICDEAPKYLPQRRCPGDHARTSAERKHYEIANRLRPLLPAEGKERQAIEENSKGVRVGYMGDINGPGCDPDTF